VLAAYRLHRNHCGLLMYFAQFTDRFALDPSQVRTPGYHWEIRANGSPLDPYLQFDHVVNPWGMSGFPLALRLEEGTRVEFAVRNLGAEPADELKLVGGRLLGRYWYDVSYGGIPNAL
jgi:hypothetical protein